MEKENLLLSEAYDSKSRQLIDFSQKCRQSYRSSISTCKRIFPVLPQTKTNPFSSIVGL